MPENRLVNGRLDSWKAIAAYLGRDVRTVVRWEKNGLPIHRVPGGQRQAVFAYQHELDAWLVSQDDGTRATNLPNLPDKLIETPAESSVVTAAPRFEPGTYVLRPVRSRKWMLLGAGACLLGLIGVVTILLTLSDSAAGVHLSSPEKLTDDARYKINLRTDGKTLYFNEFEVGREVLRYSPVGGGPIRTISTPFSNVDLQDLSNDGQRLLVMSFEGSEPEKQLWIIPAQGGVGHRVGDVGCRLARWSPDNRHIACLTRTTITVLNSDGFNTRMVGPFNSVPVQLAWSPDGSRLRFVLAGIPEGNRSPWEIAINEENDASLPRRLALGGRCCGDLASTGNGRYFVYMKSDTEDKAVLAVRPENGRLADSPGPETELPIKIGTVQGFAPTRTGNALYVLIGNTSRGELLKFDSTQNAPHAIHLGLSATLLSFSRDSQWMTYVNTLDSSLWRSRIDGTDAIRLTKPPMVVQLSAWSPDGQQIAFMGLQPGKPWRIFLIGREGGVPEEASLGNDNQGAPTWSADGKSLAYGNVECQPMQECWIRVLHLATKSVERLPGSLGYRTARWSPDGKYIAALIPATHDLMVFEFAKQRWRLLAKSITGDNMSWSSDSQFIFADSPQGKKPIIERIRIRDGKRVTAVDLAPLERLPGKLLYWFGLDPDNSPIVFQELSASEVYAMDWKDR